MARILLVDDDVNTINVLQLMLEQCGYEILLANNGEEGLNAARDERPDLIITDVLMPVMDGYTFYKKLKEEPTTKNIPVIILTARGAMESAFEAIGVDRFMEKPVERPDLMVAIVSLLERPHFSADIKRHQRVLVGGTYPEVLEAIKGYVCSFGHEVVAVDTTADVLKKSVEFKEDLLILEVQMESGGPSAEVIKAVRLLPELRAIPILLYSYYRVSDLGSPDFRRRIINIELAKDACMEAGGTDYFDRYTTDLFKDWVIKYI